MKALFSRFKDRAQHSKDKDRCSAIDNSTSTPREKLSELPQLPDWPPPQRVTSTPNSFQSFKPLPDLTARPLPPIDAAPPPIALSDSQTTAASNKTNDTPSLSAPPVEDGRIGLGLRTPMETPTQRQDTDSSGHASRKTTNGTVASTSDAQNQKKVAFLSPPPTPAPMDRVLDMTSTNGDAMRSTSAPLKTNVSRFQAAHPGESRGSTSTASSSKVNVTAKNGNGSSTKATSTRTVVSPNLHRQGDTMSLNPSTRSGTPYSQTSQSTSRILATASWSEAAEEDLVSNLGPRERTRQEVLWEIVASEERYGIS